MKKLLARLKRAPTDVVGVDMGTSAVKAVRMRKTADEMTVSGVAVLPSPLAEDENGDLVVQRPVSLPGALKSRYVSLATTGAECTVKLLSFPGPFEKDQENKILDSLGIASSEEPRVSYSVVREGHARTETRVLAVAMPEEEAQTVLSLFPSGLPAPYSLEVAGVAALSAFYYVDEVAKAQPVGLVEFGTRCTTLSLFSKGHLALVRRFAVGTSNVIQSVCRTLGVDADTAEGIVSDGAFDISQSVSEVLAPVVKQVIISRDFVERREDCHIDKIFVAGPPVLAEHRLDQLRSSLEVDVAHWNPFASFNMTEGALPDDIQGQEWRFAAALGACLGTLEEA